LGRGDGRFSILESPVCRKKCPRQTRDPEVVKPEILKREELSDMVGKCNKALKDECGMRRH
jgi:hypothetical protein